MLSNQCSLKCSKGHTALELMVSATIGLGIVAITLSLTLSSQYVLGKDMARTRLNQNLRSTMDILSTDLRIAGENLTANFPVFLVQNNATPNGDLLTIRRGILSEALTVCQDINTGGSAVNYIEVGNTSTDPGCDYTSNIFAFGEFRKALDEVLPKNLRGFIVNTGSGEGEFFNFVSYNDSGTTLRLLTDQAAWSHDYHKGTSAIYLVEENQYGLSDDRIVRVEEQDTNNAGTISFGIKEFNVEIVFNDNSRVTSYQSERPWTEIKFIDISITGEDRHAGKSFTRSLSGRLFPRNILSY